MLTIDLRTTQIADTDGVARPAVAACGRTITGYPAIARSTSVFAGTGFGSAAWSAIERKPMPKVDLHPDRWPLFSPS